MRKTTSGFTMVEILVVIAVIGILATITFMGFGRYQADTRDNARSSQATIIAEALEKYYEQNGEYPGCPALTGSAATVTTSVLPGIQSQTLLTPEAPAGTTNSIQCTDLTSSSQPDFFAYVGDTSSTCLTGADCLIFQLKYLQESTGQIITINSRHKTTLAVSGAPILSATPDGTNGFTQINSSWSTVASSTSYDLQRSTDSNFSTNLVTTNTTNTAISSTGLSYGAQYFFRARANSATGSGPWSSTVIVSTWSLSAPSVTATATSSTTFTSSWATIPHATSYNVQCSYDNTNWGSSYCGAASTTATSFNWGPTGQGTKVYFRTQAVNGAYISSWSASASATSSVDPPAAYSMSYGNTSATWNTLSATSNAVCTAAGTTPSYNWYANGSLWVSGTQYQSVTWTYSNWNQSVTLTVATACITSVSSSSYVWANNSGSGSLIWPSSSVTGIAFRTMGWSGTCPTYTTSYNYNWFVMANRGGWSAGANNVTYTSYANTGIAWGDGDIRVTINCNGPWGTASAGSWYDYGSGCVPTITTSWCTY